MQTENIRNKLFQIQKSVKTFAQTEESDKKANGKPDKGAYLYTPGWKIVEAVRAEMDKMGLMLDPQVIDESHEMLTYPIYKELNGQVMVFEKKEMYVTLKMSFTWVDTTTGEQAGPYMIISSGANGTDKSIASAFSMAERYFLLKYFHITTRDPSDEVDAHDSSNIPGGIQLPDVKDCRTSQICTPNAKPSTVTYSTPERAAQQQFAPQPQPQYQQQNPRPQDLYEKAVSELMNFGKGTQSHTVTLNKWLIALNQSGYETSNPTFASNLIETAQARREHRAPILK